MRTPAPSPLPLLDMQGGIQTALPWAEYQPPLVALQADTYPEPDPETLLN